MGPETPIRIPNSDAQRKSRAKTAAEIALKVLSSRALPVAVGAGLLGLCVQASGNTIQGAAAGTAAGVFSGLIVRGFQRGPYS
jgi:hypothetical protein